MLRGMLPPLGQDWPWVYIVDINESILCLESEGFEEHIDPSKKSGGRDLQNDIGIQVNDTIVKAKMCIYRQRLLEDNVKVLNITNKIFISIKFCV